MKKLLLTAAFIFILIKILPAAEYRKTAAGSGNVTAEGLATTQIPYALNATGIDSSANLTYNDTIQLLTLNGNQSMSNATWLGTGAATSRIEFTNRTATDFTDGTGNLWINWIGNVPEITSDRAVYLKAAGANIVYIGGTGDGGSIPLRANATGVVIGAYALPGTFGNLLVQGNVSIGQSTDGGQKLVVNGTVNMTAGNIGAFPIVHNGTAFTGDVTGNATAMVVGDDSHLHTIANLSDATANGRSLISAANYAAMRTLLDLEAGTDFYNLSDTLGLQNLTYYFNTTQTLALQNLTNYYNISVFNESVDDRVGVLFINSSTVTFTYGDAGNNMSAAVIQTALTPEWANVQNISANTTSDQATNTTSNVTFNNVTATTTFIGALKGEVTGNVSGNAGTATTASDSTDNTSIQYIQHVQAAGTVYVEPKINWINGTNMTFTVVNDTTGKQMNITGEVKAGVYQPADADLDDLADGSLTGSKVSDAAADATTKGVSTYNASDFNSASGLIALDYANGQAASTNTHGFLTDTNWNTFNNSIDTEVDPTVDTSAEILAIIGNYAIPGIRITNETINSTQITNYSIVAADVTNYTLTGTQINNASNITVNTLTATGGTGVSSFTGPDDGVTVTVSINAASAAVTAADTFINFNSTAGAIGSIGGTAVSGVVAYNTMTFSHYTQVIDKTNIEPSMLLEIVEGKPDFDKKQLFKTRICRTKKSKQAIGTFGGTNKDGYDLCLAGGTAFVFVKNTGRNIGIGDLFYSSDMPGCVELQNDNTLHSYTVAKATEPIRWESEERKRLISCILLGG